MTIWSILVLLVVLAIIVLIYQFLIRPLLVTAFPGFMPLGELIMYAIFGLILIAYVLSVSGVLGPDFFNRRVGQNQSIPMIVKHVG